jgi:diguanylate cyclase
LLLPGATVEQAAALLDRLRVATPLPMSFSAGVAGWDTNETSDWLIGRADRALYRAKAAGRNQVHPSRHHNIEDVPSTVDLGGGPNGDQAASSRL